METTIVYDAYIGSNNRDSNTGKLTNVTVSLSSSTIYHGIYCWDIPIEGLTELQLKVKIKGWMNPSEHVGVTAKIDLYAVSKPVDENNVTWNNAPKVELLKKDFLTLVKKSSPLDAFEILNLSPYINDLKYGIMLKMNDSYFVTTGGAVAGVDFYSSESEKPPVLVYNYDEKPLSPTIISPAWGRIINKKTTPSIRFDWQSLGQINYIFEYSQDNIAWTKLEGTTAKFINLDTSGLTNGDLYARVKIKSNNVWSDYSQTWFLQIGEKPNAPIVSLIGITTSTPIVSWDVNPLQKMYQVQVLQGGTIIVDSGEIQGTVNQYILKSRLEDNKSYTFKVRIADEYNIWSDWSTKAATVNFIKPPMPKFSLYLNLDRGNVFIKVQNPIPETGEELTVFNDIFRKEGNGEWLRIATNVISEFNDLTIKPKSDIYYKVRAIGQNGYVDSTIKGTEFLMKYSDLSVVGELEKHVKLKYNDRKQQNSGYTGSLLVFSGRNKPVAEFDDSRTNDIALEFEITNKKDLDILQDIIDSRKTLLYRDSRGRKLYGSVISKLNIQDSEFNYYTVGFTFTETDFNEVV